MYIKYFKKNANMISIILESCVYIYVCVCAWTTHILMASGKCWDGLLLLILTSFEYSISIYLYTYMYIAFITISTIIIMYLSYPSFQSHFFAKRQAQIEESLIATSWEWTIVCLGSTGFPAGKTCWIRSSPWFAKKVSTWDRPILGLW